MKKQLKKIIILCLAAMLMIGGCGEKTENEQQADPTPDISVEEVIEVTETPEIKEDPFEIHISENQKTYLGEQSQKDCFYLQYSDVTATGGDCRQLLRAIENWSMERSTSLREDAEELSETADFAAAEQEDFYGHSLYQTVTIARADEQIVSLLEDVYQYTGGSHGNSYLAGVNFDANTGKRLQLSDLITDYENFKVEAVDRIISELTKSYEGELYDNFVQNVESLWDDEQEPEWYVDASGIVIILQEYCAGPYVIGRPKVHFPYEEFEYYIKQDYIPADAEGVAYLEKNQEVYLNTLGQTEAVPMMLKYEWEDEAQQCSLWIGNTKEIISEFATLEKAYLVRNGEEIFCMIEIDMASDDCVTYIYRLTQGVIQAVDEINAAIDAGNINKNGVTLESWIYLLGTYGGQKQYTFDAEQGFTTEDREYILRGNEVVLTTIADIPVTIDGAESILPAGSEIVLTATDGEGYVEFNVQGTGENGRMEVERSAESEAVMIGGVSEYELFEELPYAG